MLGVTVAEGRLGEGGAVLFVAKAVCQGRRLEPVKGSGGQERFKAVMAFVFGPGVLLGRLAIPCSHGESSSPSRPVGQSQQNY